METAEIDRDLLQHANRLRGWYQPIHAFENESDQIQPEKKLPEEQIDDPESGTERKFTNCGSKNHNTEGKTRWGDNKTSENGFHARFTKHDANQATDAEFKRVKIALNREHRSMTVEHYSQQFENLSMKLGLKILKVKIIVPTEL